MARPSFMAFAGIPSWRDTYTISSTKQYFHSFAHSETKTTFSISASGESSSEIPSINLFSVVGNKSRCPVYGDVEKKL
jgi:hypothetical protein